MSHASVPSIMSAADKAPKVKTMNKEAVCKDFWGDERNEIRFRKKNKGGMTILLKGWRQEKSTKNERCDLGHLHEVIVDKKFVYETFELSEEEVVQLGQWMLGGKT